MNHMESTSAAHLVKMTQPEEFDLVILGGGTGSTSPRGRLLEKATASP
jgi:molybdopterin biosynthesis enzyme MoaB